MNDFLLDDEEEESNDIFGIADYYSPSAYSSLPPGASREDLVSSLQSEIASGSELMKEGKRLSLYEDDDLPGTKGSLAAASIFGLLPIALGAAFAGKKGALWGSNAGIAGAKPMLDRVTREQAKAQETGLGIFKEGAARRANAEKSIAALKKDEFKEEAANARSDLSFQRQKDLVDYRAAKGGSGDGDSEKTMAERNLQRILDLDEKKQAGTLSPRETKELELLSQKGGDENPYISRLTSAGMSEIKGARNKIPNLLGLAKLSGAEIPKGLSEAVNGGLASLKSADPEGEFRPGGFISDILAKNNIDPNSRTGQLFMRVAEVGRENAIAQAGVATNQDVAEEMAKLLPRPLETSSNYQKRVTNQIQRERRRLASVIDTEIADGRTNAVKQAKILKQQGLLPDDYIIEGEENNANSILGNIGDETITVGGKKLKLVKKPNG
jgi:hypothetical protein